jgi:hypothetical protein
MSVVIPGRMYVRDLSSFRRWRNFLGAISLTSDRTSAILSCSAAAPQFIGKKGKKLELVPELELPGPGVISSPRTTPWPWKVRTLLIYFWAPRHAHHSFSLSFLVLAKERWPLLSNCMYRYKSHVTSLLNDLSTNNYSLKKIHEAVYTERNVCLTYTQK